MKLSIEIPDVLPFFKVTRFYKHLSNPCFSRSYEEREVQYRNTLDSSRSSSLRETRGLKVWLQRYPVARISIQPVRAVFQHRSACFA